MDYRYEALDEHGFQKLAQALILTVHPRTQCLPVAQPDGGRDAVLFHFDGTNLGFVVFQVKYSRDPGSKSERVVVEDLIASEKNKVAELVRRGATHYYFVTNVSGTAHLDSGSIDKTNAILHEAFGIPAQVWWRDDLDRRLDNSEDIKWSYPQVLTAADVLPLLVKRLGDVDDLQAARTLKSYMATQYEADREIKFKQVDLKRTLTELFVDLPVAEKTRREDRDRRHGAPRLAAPGDLAAYINQLDVEDEYDVDDTSPFSHAGLAAAFFLQMPLASGAARFVLQGAPGQGKSTVTQFLCQVNRLRLLKKVYELEGVDKKHTQGPVRAPFRVDLRDYAEWLNGRHPFSKASDAQVPEEGRRSLESFLAMQVTWHSGARDVNEDQLLQFLERSHSVIVLDGFDEVADISTRTNLVEEICRAAARLDAHSRSAQLIVTSRPAAFANSPGFPEGDWVHLELKNLHRSNIIAYKDKWIEAQRLSPQEGKMVSATLDDKLEQPHLRDLARNPMQLAILLHLIHVQGAALPEKRTTLYEEYMKLFFNREAEKSTIVRDRRELLLSIHGVLAWVLQTQAEEGAGSGSITKEALRQQVKSYLAREEYSPELADRLLAGTVERVGALVSRVEGTYEFEVQPLREYFTARHLYKTSPYSPAGRVRSGTRPARFDALARSSYWTNVTRFFCGFYDVGELGTLVDGLMQLGDRDGYCLINQPRELAMMLLSDHVFSQSPRAMKRLVNYVAEEPGFCRLFARDMPGRREGMALPEDAGRGMLFNVCKERMEREVDPVRRKALRQIMAKNADWRTLKKLWLEHFRDEGRRGDTLGEAVDLGIAGRFDGVEIRELSAGDRELTLRWLEWTERYEEIAGDEELYGAARKALFDGVVVFSGRRPYSSDMATDLVVLTQFLNVYLLADVFSTGAERGRRYRHMGRVPQFVKGGLADQGRNIEGAEDSVVSFARFVVEHVSRDLEEWRTSLEPWRGLVDRGFGVAPGSYLIAQVAAVSTAVDGDAMGSWTKDGFGATRGLVDRLYFARERSGSSSWWRGELGGARDECVALRLAVVLSWGEAQVLAELGRTVSEAVDGLSAEEWARLSKYFRCIGVAARRRRPTLEDAWFEGGRDLSPRLALLLLERVADGAERRRLARRAFGRYVGVDASILRGAADFEIGDDGIEGIDWDSVVHLSTVAKRSGLEFLFSMNWSDVLRVPADVAGSVLKDCEKHCGQLIAMCENTYSMRVAGEAERVSAVADREDWFAPEDV